MQHTLIQQISLNLIVMRLTLNKLYYKLESGKPEYSMDNNFDKIVDNNQNIQASDIEHQASNDNYKSKFNTCVCPSMYPTLKSGDGLTLYTYTSFDEVCIGDIIIYPHPEKPFDVVHRIIKKYDNSVITRGDNNNKIDPYFIKFEDIIGKVISAKRETRLISLLSGRRGYLLHRLLIFKKFTIPYFTRPLSFISNLLTKSRIFNFCHSLLDLDVVHIQTEGNHKYILRYKNKAIGKKSIDTDNQWKIKFPYKLFINKDKI